MTYIDPRNHPSRIRTPVNSSCTIGPVRIGLVLILSVIFGSTFLFTKGGRSTDIAPRITGLSH